MDCLKRYWWNTALSEAFYPSIQALEVALRNSIHQAASQRFGNDFWFDDPSIISNANTLIIISHAKGQLSRAHKSIDADRIVAALSFGFWRELFYNEYEIKLWRHIIKDVFPNTPKSQRQRAGLGARIHSAKELRNRIFHHGSAGAFKQKPTVMKPIFDPKP